MCALALNACVRDLIAMSVRQLNREVSMDWTELQLGIGHDPIGIERLSRFVQPYPVVWPPQSIVRPVCITWREGERERERGREGERERGRERERERGREKEREREREREGEGESLHDLNHCMIMVFAFHNGFHRWKKDTKLHC